MDFLMIRFDVGIGLHFCIKCRCAKMQMSSLRVLPGLTRHLILSNQ